MINKVVDTSLFRATALLRSYIDATYTPGELLPTGQTLVPGEVSSGSGERAVPSKKSSSRSSSSSASSSSEPSWRALSLLSSTNGKSDNEDEDNEEKGQQEQEEEDESDILPLSLPPLPHELPCALLFTGPNLADHEVLCARLAALLRYA